MLFGKFRKIKSIIQKELATNPTLISSPYRIEVNMDKDHLAVDRQDNGAEIYVPYISYSEWRYNKNDEKEFVTTHGITIYAGSILYICNENKLDVCEYTRHVMKYLAATIATGVDPTYQE